MNYIVFCDKSEIKSYEKLFEGAADSKMLAAEPALDSNKISELIRQHNPHGIIIANTDYEISKIVEAVKSINEEHSDIRTIVIYPDIEAEQAEEIRKYTSGLITRAITSDDFIYIVDNKLGAYEIRVLNEKKAANATKGKKASAINLSPQRLVIAGVAIFVFILIVLIVSKSGDCAGEVAETQQETENDFTLPTEGTSESLLVTLPELEETEPTLQTSPTEATTAPTKPTEKATDKPTEKKNESQSQNSSSTPHTPTQAPISSQVTPDPEPVYPVYPQEPEPVPPVVTDPPYTPPASSEIVDDGRIYLDPTQITVKVGQTFEIYVTGLSAANGCSWDVQNAAVADFLSGDTIKVTVKAKGVGMTVITATSKSSGATAQCVVTVKK
ncbi:MAG: hypothetical protein ACI4RP_09605 [Acutalibacteraceae bacterium]